MPAAISLTAEVSEAGIRDLVRAMSGFQRRTQRDMYEAVRITTIDLCKSLRKQTRKAPKYLPKKAFRFGKSDPQYLTINGQLHRRMVMKQFPNSDRLARQKDLVFFQPVQQIYKARRTKRGISESWTQQSEAQLIRDAREKWGKIWNWGLAKASWGWFMWRLFNVRSNADFANRRVRVTHKHVDGGIATSREPLPDGTIDTQAPLKCVVTIINRLRYIRRAMPPGAVEQAFYSARKNLIYKANNCVKSARFD